MRFAKLLKKQSQDIEKRTVYWRNEIKKIESKRAREPPPGSQMIQHKPAEITTAKERSFHGTLRIRFI